MNDFVRPMMYKYRGRDRYTVTLLQASDYRNSLLCLLGVESGITDDILKKYSKPRGKEVYQFDVM